jgi:hypothetical protein
LNVFQELKRQHHISMPDKKNEPEFTVTDRRRFTEEDEARPVTPAAAPEPAPPAPAEVSAPPSSPSRSVISTEETAAAPTQEPPAPPTAEEQKASDDAFKASSKALDDQIKSQLGRSAKDFEMSFDRFIASLYMTALMQLGLVHQQNEQPRVDLIGARQTIDTLSLLRDKTKGNLTAAEENLIQNSLYEVQMAYVDVTNALTRAVQPASAVPGSNPFTTGGGGDPFKSGGGNPFKK